MTFYIGKKVKKLTTNKINFNTKKSIAKGLSMKSLCSYLGLDIKGKMLRDNTSLRFYDDFTRFHDFSCFEQYGHGDVIALWNYIVHYEGNGVATPIPFKEAVEEVFKIRVELEPECLSMDYAETEQKDVVIKPEITPQKLNLEMALELQQKLFGLDEADPNYIEAIDKEKDYFKETYGMTKRDWLIKNCRNQFYNNLSGGQLGLDNYKIEEDYKKRTSYAFGYLQEARGLSEETIQKFFDLGYLVQTTRKWAQSESLKGVAETTLKDGVSQTIYKGNAWTPVEDGYIQEPYSFYNISKQATWLSYDSYGNLNSMWSRGFYNGHDSMRKPQYSYMPKDRDHFSYNEHPFFFDPESPLSVKNPYVKSLIFDYLEPMTDQPKILNNKKPLLVFESTIDLMSFYDLCAKTGQKPEDYAYCSLNGAGKVINGLEDILTEFGHKNILLCLDNDRAGQKDSQKAIEYFEKRGCTIKNLSGALAFPVVNFVPCKDFNDALKAFNEGNWEFPNIRSLDLNNQENKIEEPEVDYNDFEFWD